MQYQAALDYLYSFLDSERRLHQRPAEFNLPRTAALLRALDNPQQRYPSVIIAGTKGKGSTAVMVEAMLRANGRRVGLYSSPHLHSYRERMQINRQPITREHFVAVVERLPAAVAALDPELGAPTTFELGTALALLHFADESVDLAVLEVGLGGRYDSVNAVDPLVAAITSLSFDHTRVLGATLPEIAYQKAGIIKPETPVVTAPQRADALAVLVDVAREQRAPLYIAQEAGLRQQMGAVLPYALDVATTPLGLGGAVQRENARVALGVMHVLGERGFVATPAQLAHGLATTSWPGRLEVVGSTPTIVLDGAHNGDSAAKLARALRAEWQFERLVLVLGVMHDKEIDTIFEALLPTAHAAVLTRSQHPRALLDLDALAELARPYQLDALERASAVAEALTTARRIAGPRDLICVTGSLAVVAEAREALGLPHERD
jgi:dihydrofolate synthase / folylpolyglutamate synthase